jgi:hypothetical protein
MINNVKKLLSPNPHGLWMKRFHLFSRGCLRVNIKKKKKNNALQDIFILFFCFRSFQKMPFLMCFEGNLSLTDVFIHVLQDF